MQSILREKLLAHAGKLAEVSGLYRNESYRFVESYLSWLENIEKDLSGLRVPISVLLQAEKGVLTSVLDGFTPDYVQAEKSIRKKQKAVAAHSLERVSREIHAEVERIDHVFEQMNEKLCHAIAVLASKDPTLYPTLTPDAQGVQAIWRRLGAVPETIPMFNYFSAKLSPTDREYLLFDILQKIAQNIIHPELSVANRK